jgi:sulfur carrier protein
MIKVTLNGEARSISTNIKLQDAIEQWQLASATFAIAINEQFVPKSIYASTELHDGDCVEIVVPMQGG